MNEPVQEVFAAEAKDTDPSIPPIEQRTRRQGTVLEHKQRLSRSILWKLQRDFFSRRGVEAWRQSAVPHFITSNAFIADVYAKLTFAFLRDCRPQLDLGQPFHIVELGAGHGRFGYLFLKRFLAIHQNSILREIPIHYVLTDLAESNLELLAAHPQLQPFIGNGTLDFARFDVESDEELLLRVSGDSLIPGTVRNPMVVIANYLFDSIPQDAFRIVGGRLYESLITVLSRRKELSLEDPEIFSHLEISYTDNAVGEDYYEDPDWNRLLGDYVRCLPATSVLFPTAALQCIRRLRQLSGGRMLLLSADKGYHGDEAILLGQGTPGIATHGSFSMMVDYQIIERYFLQQGGQALNPGHPHESLNVAAFLLGDLPEGCVETRQAYEDAVERFGPDDFFTLIRHLESVEDLDLNQILAFLRLGAWDHRLMTSCLPLLRKHLPTLTEIQKQEIAKAFQRSWDTYFALGEEHDLAFHLGTFLYEMQLYSEALEFFRHSVAMYGMEPGTAYNMGVCHYGLRQLEPALEYTQKALELDPYFEVAKAVLIKLRSLTSRS